MQAQRNGTELVLGTFSGDLLGFFELDKLVFKCQLSCSLHGWLQRNVLDLSMSRSMSMPMIDARCRCRCSMLLWLLSVAVEYIRGIMNNH